MASSASLGVFQVGLLRRRPPGAPVVMPSPHPVVSQSAGTLSLLGSWARWLRLPGLQPGRLGCLLDFPLSCGVYKGNGVLGAHAGCTCNTTVPPAQGVPSWAWLLEWAHVP